MIPLASTKRRIKRFRKNKHIICSFFYVSLHLEGLAFSRERNNNKMISVSY